MQGGEIELLRQLFSGLMYVGDISGIFQNTITPTCCMAPSKRRIGKTPSLAVLIFGISKYTDQSRFKDNYP